MFGDESAMMAGGQCLSMITPRALVVGRLWDNGT